MNVYRTHIRKLCDFWFCLEGKWVTCVLRGKLFIFRKVRAQCRCLIRHQSKESAINALSESSMNCLLAVGLCWCLQMCFYFVFLFVQLWTNSCVFRRQPQYQASIFSSLNTGERPFLLDALCVLQCCSFGVGTSACPVFSQSHCIQECSQGSCVTVLVVQQ